jgi:peptide deformylase|tara:strand:+ start:1080 stop:1589 length:510 start_codon:yes stop_codon:yes gene_type:complete
MKLLSSPNEFLKKVMQPFDFETMDAKQLSGEMCQIMMAKNGLGLAANQVGLDAQIFVMRPTAHAEITKPFAVINPEIIEVSNEVIETKEGCLSHIGLILTIKRPKNIVVQFLDIDAKECIIELSGIDARCFLHEYDHLNGVEFTDRVSKLKVSMAKKKQRKLIKEHTNG